MLYGVYSVLCMVRTVYCIRYKVAQLTLPLWILLHSQNISLMLSWNLLNSGIISWFCRALLISRKSSAAHLDRKLPLCNYMLYIFHFMYILLGHLTILFNWSVKPEFAGLVGVIGVRRYVRSTYSQWKPAMIGFEPRFSRLRTQCLITELSSYPIMIYH